MTSIARSILMVIPSLEMGGAQSNLLRLATEFERSGREVILLELKPEKRDQSYVDSLLSATISIFSPPFFLRDIRHRRPKFLEKRSKIQRGMLKLKSEEDWLSAFLKRKNIGAIHTHMYLADLYLSRHAPAIQKPLVWLSKQCGCYNLIASTHQTWEKSAFLRQVSDIFERLDGVVTMTKQHDDFLKNHGLTPRAKKIYNGISLPTITIDDGTGTLRCVMCARDEPTKGWRAAILGVIEASRKGAEVTLDLIGYGDHLAALQKEFSEHDSLSFLGVHPNPISLLSCYDIGLLPSTFKAESLPNTVIEYQACGLATIATKVGEIPNLVSFKGLLGGALIDTGSQEAMSNEIAKALTAYHADPKLLQAHQQDAIQLRSRFDIKKTAQAYLNFSDFLSSES